MRGPSIGTIKPPQPRQGPSLDAIKSRLFDLRSHHCNGTGAGKLDGCTLCAEAVKLSQELHARDMLGSFRAKEDK